MLKREAFITKSALGHATASCHGMFVFDNVKYFWLNVVLFILVARLKRDRMFVYSADKLHP